MRVRRSSVVAHVLNTKLLAHFKSNQDSWSVRQEAAYLLNLLYVLFKRTPQRSFGAPSPSPGGRTGTPQEARADLPPSRNFIHFTSNYHPPFVRFPSHIHQRCPLSPFTSSHPPAFFFWRAKRVQISKQIWGPWKTCVKISGFTYW